MKSALRILILGSMKKSCLIILILSIPLCSFTQSAFKSPKFSYSYLIPEGWHIKDKIYHQSVDSKAVDDKGNSFVVTVIEFPTPSKRTAKQEYEGMTNEQLENEFNGIYGDTKVIKRGTILIGGKEFYYIHFTTPFKDNLTLYHKMFSYNESYRTYSIDACAISNQVIETTPYFSVMLTSFKF